MQSAFILYMEFGHPLAINQMYKIASNKTFNTLRALGMGQLRFSYGDVNGIFTRPFQLFVKVTLSNR